MLSSTPLPTQAAKLLLHLREGHRVSQVALTTVMEKSNEMCTRVASDVLLDVKDRLISANIDTGGHTQQPYTESF